MTGPYDTGRFADVGDISSVTTITDAADVVRRMLDDLRAHPDDWENPTLERFLDALAASLEAHTGRGEQSPGEPTWELFATVLVKASGYE